MRLLDGARWRPSPIWHPVREATWGIVVHWTAGHRLGDIAALTGGHVDVQFYVTKTGEVYQFVDADREAWHAFHTANHYCVGIEHEGSGEAWTPAQLKASARLARWVCDTYDIPVRHVDPPASWRGLYGHKDLAHIDGNDHTDTVPATSRPSGPRVRPASSRRRIGPGSSGASVRAASRGTGHARPTGAPRFPPPTGGA